MKIVLEHAFPRKIDYLKLFASMGSASFYFSMDGRDIQWFGRIERSRPSPKSFDDREYFQYRASHPVKEVLADDGDEVIVKTEDGVEERWLKPRWFLRRRKLLSTVRYDI